LSGFKLDDIEKIFKSKQIPKPANDVLVNKRFSRGTTKSGDLSFTRAELLANSGKGMSSKSYSIDKKRRHTDISGFKNIQGISDDFWQKQVQRLMQETKNYKQLHFEQKLEMKECAKQNAELKKKVNIFKKKRDQLSHSLNEFRNSNEGKLILMH
jgi:uncharacterized protein YifE (UPF0438 family)